MKKTLLIAVLFTLSKSVFSQTIVDSLSVHFDSDQDVMIDAISLDQLKSKEILQIRLYAYTDSIGSDEYNNRLALNRGNTVKSELIDICTNIDVIPVGESTRYSDLASNRQVIIIYTEKKWQPVEPQPIIEEVITLNVEFLPEQDVIRDVSYDEVLDFLELLKTKTYSGIELHGHVCCAPGQNLSEMRAKAVARELVQSGVDPAIIKTFGHSNTRPLVPETSQSNKRKNRRVEVLLIK